MELEGDEPRLHGPNSQVTTTKTLSSSLTNLTATREDEARGVSNVENFTSGARCFGARKNLTNPDYSDADIAASTASQTYALRNRTIQLSKNSKSSDFDDLVHSAQQILSNPNTNLNEYYMTSHPIRSA